MADTTHNREKVAGPVLLAVDLAVQLAVDDFLDGSIDGHELVERIDAIVAEAGAAAGGEPDVVKAAVHNRPEWEDSSGVCC